MTTGKQLVNELLDAIYERVREKVQGHLFDSSETVRFTQDEIQKILKDFAGRYPFFDKHRNDIQIYVYFDASTGILNITPNQFLRTLLEDDRNV